MVRVHCSDETPHTINKRTGFYIRGEDICAPRPLTDDEISLLRNKRRKIIERREWILERTYKRVFPDDVKRNYLFTPIIYHSIPIFPTAPLIKREELYNLFQRSRLPLGDNDFPFYGDSIKTASEGIYSFIPVKEGNCNSACKENFAETNVFGGVSYFENAVQEFQPRGAPAPIVGIWVTFELNLLIKMMYFIKRYYKNLGYWGIIRFFLRVEQCRAVTLIQPRPVYLSNADIDRIETDSDIEIKRDLFITEIMKDCDAIIADIFKEFLWSCGMSVHRASDLPIMQWIDKEKRDMFGAKKCPKCEKSEISGIDDICKACAT